MKEAMEELLDGGIHDVVVQPVHVLGGLEYQSMTEELQTFKESFSQIVVGAPMLSSKIRKRLFSPLEGKAGRRPERCLCWWDMEPAAVRMRCTGR